MLQQRIVLGAALLLPAWLLAPVEAASAEPHCMTRILADVPALEAPEQIKSKRNGTFGPVTHLKVAKRSGRMYYCSGTSYCYGSNAFQFTSLCRFKLDKAGTTDDFFQYSAR